MSESFESSESSLSPLPPVRVRSCSDLAELLPYVCALEPRDQAVVLGLHEAQRGTVGKAGATMRIDLPATASLWIAAAEDAARMFVAAHKRRGEALPDHVVLYLCPAPIPGQSAHDLAARMGLLAGPFRAAFSDRRLPVLHALCVDPHHFWCLEVPCHHGGVPHAMPRPGRARPGPVSAAAVAQGLTPAARREDIQARTAPITGDSAARQADALNAYLTSLTLPAHTSKAARDLAAQIQHDTKTLLLSAHDTLSTRGEYPTRHIVARVLLGLQNRELRDWAALLGVTEGTGRPLWLHLARNCVAPYRKFATAPLTLYGFTSWLADDTAAAHVALDEALRLDPGYQLASLLKEALSHGLPAHNILDLFRAADEDDNPAD
ncbi:DUF4192 domain-containing protein [Streptomyces sp. NPDC059991]